MKNKSAQVKEAMANGNFNTSSASIFTKDVCEKGLEDYNPFEHRDPNGLGTMGALSHMIKGSLGSGILAMPLAFKNAGLWAGLIGAFLIGYLCTHCVHLLVMCSHVLSKRTKKPSLGFAETTEAAFLTGPESLRRYSTISREFVNWSLLVSYYLGDTVYVVFIGTTFKQVADKYFNIDLDIRIYILMLTVVLVPMGCISSIKYLVPLSLVAICFLMFGCGFVLYEVFLDLPPTSSRPFISSLDRLPMFYATMCFSIEGIGTVMPVENAMRNPRHFLTCPGVLNIAMMWLIFTYSMVGFFGYLRYGEDTEGSIILNLGYSFMGETVKMLVAFNLMFSYPLLLFVCVNSMWRYLEHRVSPANQTLYYYAMRVALVLLTIILACSLPNLEPIIGLVGTICYSTLGILFPSVLELITFWGPNMGLWRFKNYFLIVAWLICLVAGLKSSIESIIDVYSTSTVAS